MRTQSKTDLPSGFMNDQRSPPSAPTLPLTCKAKKPAAVSTSHLRLFLLLSLIACVSTVSVTNVHQQGSGHTQQHLAYMGLSSIQLAAATLMCTILANVFRSLSNDEKGIDHVAAPIDGGEGEKGSAAGTASPTDLSTNSSSATIRQDSTPIQPLGRSEPVSAPDVYKKGTRRRTS